MSLEEWLKLVSLVLGGVLFASRIRVWHLNRKIKAIKEEVRRKSDFV